MNNLYLQGLSVGELETLIEQTVTRCLKGDVRREHKPASSEIEFLTRKETAHKLGVSLVTLRKWTMEGIIPSYRISTRIRYKRAEIEEALQQVKSLKYKRHGDNRE